MIYTIAITTAAAFAVVASGVGGYRLGQLRGIAYADRTSYQAGYTAGHTTGYLQGIDAFKRNLAESMGRAAAAQGEQAAAAFVRAVERGDLRQQEGAQ